MSVLLTEVTSDVVAGFELGVIAAYDDTDTEVIDPVRALVSDWRESSREEGFTDRRVLSEGRTSLP